MARYAEVLDGKVKRVFRRQTGGLIEDASDTASPGWSYDGATFSAPDPEPEPVPESVSKLQLRNACIETSHSGSNWWVLAKSALANSDASTQEEWELASVINRDDTTFTGFANALGADDEDIDAVFRLAATK